MTCACATSERPHWRVSVPGVHQHAMKGAQPDARVLLEVAVTCDRCVDAHSGLAQQAQFSSHDSQVWK